MYKIIRENDMSLMNSAAIRCFSRVTFTTLLCLGLVVLVWIMDRASINVAPFTYGFTYGFFVNALPVTLAFLSLLALFNRIWLAYLTALLAAATLYAINHLKLKYLHVPVSFSDVYLLENLHVATLKLLAEYVSILQIVLVAMVVAVLIGLAVWVEKPWFKPRSSTRILLAAFLIYGIFSIA